MRIAIDNLPSATMVPNEFIDRIMPAANGEYVKVFLYLLRHNGEEITPAHIADALELTEGDVRRALMRWQREGLISVPLDNGKAAQAAPETPVPAVQELTESISEIEDIVPAAGPAGAEQIPAAGPAGAEQIPVRPHRRRRDTRLRLRMRFRPRQHRPRQSFPRGNRRISENSGRMRTLQHSSMCCSAISESFSPRPTRRGWLIFTIPSACPRIS